MTPLVYNALHQQVIGEEPTVADMYKVIDMWPNDPEDKFISTMLQVCPRKACSVKSAVATVWKGSIWRASGKSSC